LGKMSVAAVPVALALGKINEGKIAVNKTAAYILMYGLVVLKETDNSWGMHEC
jgi:hypothetical protein